MTQKVLKECSSYMPGVPDMRNLVEGWRPIFTVITPDHGLRAFGIVHVFRFLEKMPSHLSIAP